MKFLDLKHFHYSEGTLYCENVPVKKIVKEYGTPIYIYSKNFFKERYTNFENAFRYVDNRIYFACKANYNLNTLKIFLDLGAGIDVNSAGELHRAYLAGAKPEDIILTGVGKTAEEIKIGIKENLSLIKAESEQEVYLIDKIAGRLKKTAPVAIRVNPDVDPKTHPYISTGLAYNKFGIAASQAEKIYLDALKLKNIKLTGLDMHIGSQITSVGPYVEAVEKTTEMYKKLKNLGVPLEHLDIGGGYGINYHHDTPIDINELAKAVEKPFKELGGQIMFEPGRYLTGNGGILVTDTLYTKKTENKNFIIVDAAMNDLLRPSIYGAYHHIQPVDIKLGSAEIVADIVGPVCESGDFLAKDREIPDVSPGDLLSVMTAGAYGVVMSSNYNARRRPPEIFVDGDKYFCGRSRETYEYLLHDEKLVEGLH